MQSILKAKKKPIETIKIEDLGIDLTPRLKVEKVEMPSERKGGVIVKDVDELVSKLMNEAKVIWASQIRSPNLTGLWLAVTLNLNN